MTNSEEMQLATRARLILEDDLVIKAFADMEASIVGQWADLGVENKTQAEELKRLLWASRQFKAIFHILVANGTVAQNELLLESNMRIKQQAALERVRNG